MDSSIEIKVTNPKKVDNVVHPAAASSSPQSSVSSPSRDGRGKGPQLEEERSQNNRRGQQGRRLVNVTPFKNWVSWLIPAFVLANVVIFLISMFINNCPKNSTSCVAGFLGRFSFQPMKENPLLGPSAATLEVMGALDVIKIVHEHQAWRMVSCIWLHAGVFHILANMLSLVFIGVRLEQEFGFVRIGLLYLIAGFGGSLMSSLFIQTGISVGASGALFGLLGSMLSELITNWTIYANKLAALLTLIFIIVINLAMGVLPHVDNFAHIGGFLSGFLLGFVFLIRPQFGYVSKKHVPPGYIVASSKPKHKPYQYVLWLVSLMLLIVGFTGGIILLLQGVNVNDHCSWCHYLSCVPTALWSCRSQQQVYCEVSFAVPLFTYVFSFLVTAHSRPDYSNANIVSQIRESTELNMYKQWEKRQLLFIG
ncbi:Detected protein of confused Function [Hibiscus syriacus]|uniref:RHOMBOID-like protein n=1 Tax=Hibiscus syriacus TaxID=106335 RepID=A0A6A3A8Z9_HIBSY|nr:Detected protein of confused Function [Hibiscus syriacus]